MGVSAATGIKSIQRGVLTIGNSQTSGTATISAVNTANVTVDFLGNDSADTSFGYAWVKMNLQDSTTVAANRMNASVNVISVSYQVTEFY